MGVEVSDIFRCRQLLAHYCFALMFVALDFANNSNPI